MNALRVERTVFWLVPACVLLAAFAGLCVMTGTAWPWNHVVHEDGRRTLLSTVFYVEHATRELLPDALLALAVAGAVRYYFPPVMDARRAGLTDASHLRLRLMLVAAVTLTVIVGGTLWTDGLRTVIDNLSQLHTRDGAPLVWGAHWRYHLIERFAEMLLAFSASGAVWMLRMKPPIPRVSGRFTFYGLSLLVFAVATVVFRPTAEPFRDPVFLGHQLRELFTHSLVTLPLALGMCLALSRRYSTTSPTRSTESARPIILSGAAAILSGAFLLVASLLTHAQSAGQATGLAALLFPHFAEHALGYVLVPALAGVIYLVPAKT
jgi:hypothetical protein